MTDKGTLKWKLAQALEYRWWQRYLKKKDTSEYLTWKKQYWVTLLQSFLSDTTALKTINDKTVLDAGCGPAGIFLSLQGNTVDAMDPLLDKYKSLPHFIPEQYPWVSFINSTIEALHEAAKYDLIFCMNAINHVSDIELCYDNLFKALKPGGYLIISTDAHRYTFLKKIFQLLPGDVLHPIQLDIEDYNKHLTQRGFKIIKDTLYQQEAIFNYHITLARKQAKFISKSSN